MKIWTRLALVGLLGGALVGCDGGGTTGTDGGPRPDGGPQPDGGPRPDGQAPSCPDEVTVSGEITEDTTWACPVYVLSGRVFVVNDSTLTIGAGTVIFSDTTNSEAAALIVTRGSRLVAEGTADAPIVMTSGNPDGARATGDWAGVVLLGSASTNDGSCVSDGDPGTEACDAPGYLEDRIEGIDAGDPRSVYGGTDDTSDCGSLRYVRIEFAGRELSPDNELNGLTIGGCGSETRLSYIQVHRGQDDGIEFFGGTASMDHVVISGAADDSLDYDEGWRGNVQFLVVHQYPGLGDNGFEADNLGSNESATPRSRPTMWNVTMVGTTSNRAMLLREGVEGIYGNFLVHTYGQAPDVVARQAAPGDSWPANFVFRNSHFYMVTAFPAEDLDAAGVYAVAREMDPTVPETRPAMDEGLSSEQRSLIRGLERDRLNDDLGFDEAAEVGAAELNNVLAAPDPGLGSTSITAPDFVPTTAPAGGTPSFNSFAPSGFGDTSATYAGAFASGGTDWSAGWTAYPEN